MRRTLCLLAALPLATLSVASLPAQQSTESKWDVAKNLGFDRTLDFQTSEGTWMSVDVSPDGRWVAFDMLDDIYKVAMTGGAAERMTSGRAWYHIPRRSPSGNAIAFVSDRDGADN